MDTIGSGLSVASLVTIGKVVSGLLTMGSAVSAVAFSSFPKCKF